MTSTMIERATGVIDRTDPFLLVARLSLLVTLVNTHHDIPILLFTAVATAVLFLNGRLLRSPWPWFVLAAGIGASQFAAWWLIDDHRVANTYWLAAVGLSRLAHEPGRVLTLTGRFLIGSLFAFAFGWKLLSSQYLSTDFFQYTLLRDDRFEPVAVVVGGADEDQLAMDRALVSEFTGSAAVDETITIEDVPRTRTVAGVFTFWGLVIEGALAAAFLLPLRGRARVARPVLLLLFCATTYAIVPVVGFGALLMVVGLAQAETDWHRRLFALGSVAIFVWSLVIINLIL